MFAIIKKRCNIGDSVSISTAAGDSFSGNIVDIDDSTIVISNESGEENYILGEDIKSFKKIKVDAEISSSPKVVDGSKSDNGATDKQDQKTGASKDTTEPSSSSSPKPAIAKPEFKVGDVIPIETLRKIDPKFDKKRLGTKSSPKVEGESVSPARETSVQKTTQATSITTPSTGKKSVYHDFSELGSLTQKSHEIENQNFVPAIGTVSSFYPDRAFGFIFDVSSREHLYFSASQIIDDKVKANIGNGTPVIYTILEQQQSLGPKAIAVHRAGTIADLLALADDLEKKKEFKKAMSVVEHILAEYPDNFDAEMKRRALKPHIPSAQTLPWNKEYSAVYTKAKKYHEAKNYDEAIKYYLKSISIKQKVDSSIKDLAMLYAFLYKSNADNERGEEYKQTAIDFMHKHRNLLPKNISTLNYLENFYYSVWDYDNFLEVIDELLDNQSVTKDKGKFSTLLTKKAVILIRMGKQSDAMECVEEALEVNPNNLSAAKIKLALEHPESGDINEVISAAEFNTLASGLSYFITQTLDEFNDYYGVPPKVIESGEFNEITLKGVRGLIENLGRGGRSRERARYLLTEAKLMTMIEEDNIIKLRSELARYCNAMALNSLYDNMHADIVRFYYNEAFSLEQKWDSTNQQVTYYLLTSVYTSSELINAITKNNSVDDTLKIILSGDFDQRKWEIILSMFLNNPEISAQMTSKFYSNITYRKFAIQALSHFGVKGITISSPKEEFVNAWNSAREIRQREYRQAVTSIKSIGDNANIEEYYYFLLNLKQFKKDWMTALDINRLFDITNNIAPAIETYIKSTGYRNKESSFNNAKGQIQQLVEDIKKGPTSLSYDALLQLMHKTLEVLNSSFQDVIKMSEPRITLTLLSSETVVDQDNVVSLQISISNNKDSSPIREASVSIASSDDIQYIDEENSSYNAIDGGENRIFKLRIRVSENVIKNKAAVLDASCKYKTGNETKQKNTQLSLKLYSPEDYIQIDNPYAAVADSGPVPVDSPMFFGRDEFIANVANSIIQSPSKQVIIYGQKRCGKSSVLLHLQDKLTETGKTFCIFFSLGDIIGTLSEAAFYHKILSTIAVQLELLELDGKSVPNISFPSYAEFKAEDEDNPLNTFTKYMTRFKHVCKNTGGWEDKNLVVMIDEFTYLYTEIKNGNVSPSIMKQWKAVTQNPNAQFSVVLVGQDVVPSFKKEDYARNAFGVIEDVRLTYLDDEPARNLIEEPVRNEDGSSRYIGNAVTRIIDYTSRNPYYIQIFCARMVNYMNKNKLLVVTEADVNDVAKTFIKGEQALEEDKFDNLIRAGEAKDLQEYAEEDLLKVLHAIAIGTKNVPYCNREDIDVIQDKELEENVLKNLVDREVLEKKGKDNYKIQVKLFQEWLLNH